VVRRTKEDALATRNSLLDAAEVLFQAQGVSRTSLSDIAREAGTTRGAIYWHFKDKADLFNAMMERVTLPLEQAFQDFGADSSLGPLDAIRQAMKNALVLIASDERTRRVFEVATQKVEYIDELLAVRLRHLTVRNEFLSLVERGLRLAAIRQKLDAGVSMSNAAQGLHAMVDGLIQNWLLDTTGFDLAATGGQVIDIYLKGLGFSLEPAGSA
jgi:TetR/AcrR family acrAB operon transcriptional repressor